jgi:hypothetical protein
VVRAGTDRPFLVNFVLHFPPDPLPAALDAGAPVVTFSWGDAAPHVGRVRAAGALVGVQVATPEGARRAADAGADFLICQGIEAGGTCNPRPRSGVCCRALWSPRAGCRSSRRAASRMGPASRGRCGSGRRRDARHPVRRHAGKPRPRHLQRALVGARGRGGHGAHRLLRWRVALRPRTGSCANSTFAAWEAAGSPALGSAPARARQSPAPPRGAGSCAMRMPPRAPATRATCSPCASTPGRGAGVGNVTDVPSAAELVARLGPSTRLHWPPDGQVARGATALTPRFSPAVSSPPLSLSRRERGACGKARSEQV